MLERRRRRKGYGVVPQDTEGGDLELAEGGSGAQETGVTDERDEAWNNLDEEGNTERDGRVESKNGGVGDGSLNGK